MTALTQPNKTGNVPVWRDILESVVLAVILAAIIRLFVAQPFYISMQSMEPTVLPNDWIIVNMLVYRFHPPQRGDIVVLRYPLDPSRDFIKRVVGLEGETVEIRQNDLIINGKRVDELYLPKVTMADFGPEQVPQGYYFVMGDNRGVSSDSRAWGPLPGKNIIGKAFFIYWPPSEIGLIK